MKIKFAITCHNCDCTFELNCEKAAQRDRVQCPCCGSAVPSRYAEPLLTAMTALQAVPKYLGHFGDPVGRDIDYPADAGKFTIAIKPD